MFNRLGASPVRVLIVDDSIVVRKAVSDALESDPGIDVVGTAVNGEIALEKISELSPDVLILDIEMPVCNGFEVLQTLRAKRSLIRVIMFSTLTERGAMQTIKALSLGANDYVSKPCTDARNTSYKERVDGIAFELIPKIKQFRSRSHPPITLPKRVSYEAVPPTRHVQDDSVINKPKVVAIGISTGGPEALSAVLPLLSADFPVPIVIVQHMPPLFTKLLSKRLDSNSKIQVLEGEDGMFLKAGTAYFAPGNYHMLVVQKGSKFCLSINQNPPENSCRPAADVLFRSVAEVYGAFSLGVIMTGMGKDGLQGSRMMKKAGASIIVQDEATSVVWGMPSCVVNEGLADQVLPLNQLAETIEHCVLKGPSLMASR